MVRITLAQLGEHETVALAVAELHKYLKTIDSELMIDERIYDAYDPDVKKVIWVGIDKALSARVPTVRDAKYDDAILIDIQKNAGVITGSNERSVLIAAYRLLKEMGVKWIRPTFDGEIVPHYAITGINLSICEKPSRRHRAICIEGSDGYEHIRELIEWIPRAGLNGYYFQFPLPFTFFDKWYTHLCNELFPNEGVSRDDVAHLVRSLRREIKRRSLLLHDVGHGWTVQPMGFDPDNWGTVSDEDVPADKREFLAMVDGKRKLHKNMPMATNLCYSNPVVRRTMNENIANYCEEHPDIDFLHFWLADGMNNMCTCEKCVDSPSDYFVAMLNELDEELTRRGLDTKVVFLLYCDLLWAPVKEKFKNPDRFVLMFAPIARGFLESYDELDPNTEYTHEPFRLNDGKNPVSLAENVALLRDWQKVFSGDSFVYDYHLCLWKTRDTCHFDMAKTLFRDMAALESIGIDGMVSCQHNRASFPSNLCMQMMADALWDKTADFEECSSAYLRDAYGADSEAVKEYFRAVSRLLELPPDNLPAADVQIAGYREVLRRTYEMDAIVSRNLAADHPAAVKKSWELMVYHREILVRYIAALIAKAEGDEDKCERLSLDVVEYARLTNAHTHRYLDIWNVYSLLMRNCKVGNVLKSSEQMLYVPD